jgi:predicted protein tyrosine phosphatase
MEPLAFAAPRIVAVCGLHELENTLKLSQATALISLVDSDGSTGLSNPIYLSVSITPERHLLTVMDDVSTPFLPHAPSRGHVDSLLSFYRQLGGCDRLVVNCTMGISRSAAVALGLLAMSATPEDAGQTLFELRRIANPNPLIVKLFDERLRLGGALTKIADDVRGRSAVEKEAASRDKRILLFGRDL